MKLVGIRYCDGNVSGKGHDARVPSLEFQRITLPPALSISFSVLTTCITEMDFAMGPVGSSYCKSMPATRSVCCRAILPANLRVPVVVIAQTSVQNGADRRLLRLYHDLHGKREKRFLTKLES
jgi:hypothetical protein